MQIVEKEHLDKLRKLFKEIRFHMGNSVLDGKMGQAYADNADDPRFAILLLRSYCFMSGNVEKEELKEIIHTYDLKKYKIFPSDNLKRYLEEIFQDSIRKSERYSIKKNPEFNAEQLSKYSEYTQEEYEFVVIEGSLAKRIVEEEFIKITDDYEKNGIGYACIYHNELIGVASSNFIYKDGIEVNIRVREEYRKKGIATALAAKLILLCIQKNMTISWDAANLSSLRLAEKLGFQYDSTYHIYQID